MSEPMKLEASVKIRPNEGGYGGWSVLIDGVEMAGCSLADSMTITLPNDECELGKARVTMTLLTDLDFEAPAIVEPTFSDEAQQ